MISTNPELPLSAPMHAENMREAVSDYMELIGTRVVIPGINTTLEVFFQQQ